MTAELLARIQFAFTISFHIVYPAITIGLASYLAVLEALWLKTGKDTYLALFKFWLRIFAVAFAMGVVSGIVMSYQFGTNWGAFAEATAPVLGPLLAYEVLTAFFLEAGFLGVMLFGLERVGRKLHFTATLLVAIGTLISAFWILSANSWMQTPVGFIVGADGRFEPASWLAVIFNPSFPYRFAHMVMAAFLSTACVVVAVGAWHLNRHEDRRPARTMVRMGVLLLAIGAPLQLFIGDMHGLNTQEHQPAKVAAMEGHFETVEGAPLYLFGIPDSENETLRYAVGIPKLGSLILKHDPDAEVTGLDAFPRDERPPVGIVFWAFRLMVGIGLLMIAYGLVGAWCWWRGRLDDSRWFRRWSMLMGPAGLVAILSGWFVTEVGRQPWLVYGLMARSDGLSPIDAPAVAGSLTAFVIVYTFIFGSGTFYLLRLMRKPPFEAPAEPAQQGPIRTAEKTPFERPGPTDGTAS